MGLQQAKIRPLMPLFKRFLKNQPVRTCCWVSVHGHAAFLPTLKSAGQQSLGRGPSAK